MVLILINKFPTPAPENYSPTLSLVKYPFGAIFLVWFLYGVFPGFFSQSTSVTRSDHVTKNAWAARNNKAQGLGNVFSTIVANSRCTAASSPQKKSATVNHRRPFSDFFYGEEAAVHRLETGFARTTRQERTPLVWRHSTY